MRAAALDALECGASQSGGAVDSASLPHSGVSRAARVPGNAGAGGFGSGVKSTRSTLPSRATILLVQPLDISGLSLFEPPCPIGGAGLDVSMRVRESRTGPRNV
jgi:hypothetical protein